MLEILILSAAIGVGGTRGPASEKEDALKALAKASYVQSGTDKKVKQFERRVLNKELKEYSGWIAGITKVATEKKLSFEWTF